MLFIAKTFAGLEALLNEELQTLGAQNCKSLSRSVQFEGDFALLYKVNYYSRLALRVLWQVDTFTFANNNQFYEHIFNFPAEKYLTSDGTMAVSATLAQSIFASPLFASVLTKDAICDRMRDRFGERPSVDKENPDVQFHLHIFKDRATLYLDSSGESLHKRGYKVSQHPATLNEVTAAAMIKLSGWKMDCDFIDGMCGGGTLLIEAAMAALNIPAGFYRQHFGFFTWRNFDKELWQKTTDAASICEDVPIDFYGYDISPRFLGMARTNVEQAELQDFIHLSKQDMFDSHPKRKPSCIIINPPYGERLEVEEINDFYQRIGDTWKSNYAGCTACLISSNAEAVKHVGLHPSIRADLFNGSLACKFMKYELYSGSKKA
jgi:putative N6-adenine-specific DNA methylase